MVFSFDVNGIVKGNIKTMDTRSWAVDDGHHIYPIGLNSKVQI